MLHPGTLDGLQVGCRQCSALATLLRQYSLNQNDIVRILESQSYKCAVCASDISIHFVVDHDHACCPGSDSSLRSCGKCVRGLLCDRCNLGLGSFRDSVTALQGAIEYLNRFRHPDEIALLEK